MKQIKVSEATGAALDHLVMLCEGWIYEPESARPAFFRRLVGPAVQYLKVACPVTTNWSQAGPIIERERIELSSSSNEGVGSKYRCINGVETEVVVSVPEVVTWTAFKNHGQCMQNGPTPLIAAMRCFAASKLGDTVEVPEELL